MATRKVDQTPKKRPRKGPKKAELWDLKDVHARIDRKGWGVLRDVGIDENLSVEALIIEGLNLALAARGRPERVERRTPEMSASNGGVPTPVQPQGKLPLGVAPNSVEAPHQPPAGE